MFCQPTSGCCVTCGLRASKSFRRSCLTERCVCVTLDVCVCDTGHLCGTEIFPICLFLQNEFQAREDSMGYHLHTLALVYVEVRTHRVTVSTHLLLYQNILTWVLFKYWLSWIPCKWSKVATTTKLQHTFCFSTQHDIDLVLMCQLS